MKKNNPEITPAIIAHSKPELIKKLKNFEPFFSTAQIDLMDDCFVANKTISPIAIKGLRTRLDLEFHLMVKHPLTWAKRLVSHPKTKRIIFHYEACKDDQEILDTRNFIHKKNIEVGLAINPMTKVTSVEHLISVFDSILIMGVTPGKAGQKLRLSTLKKLGQVRKLNRHIKLQFDGGANQKTIGKIVDSGAQRIAVGSVLEESNDKRKTISGLKKMIK